MATNKYLIIARDVTTDATDNMNSIIKIIDKFTFTVDIEQFNVQQAQVIVPANFAIATSWKFDKPLPKQQDIGLRIVILLPGDIKVQGPKSVNSLPKGITNVNLNINNQGLPINRAGAYKLKVELFEADTDKIIGEAETDFEVEIIDIQTSSNN